MYQVLEEKDPKLSKELKDYYKNNSKYTRSYNIIKEKIKEDLEHLDKNLKLKCYRKAKEENEWTANSQITKFILTKGKSLPKKTRLYSIKEEEETREDFVVEKLRDDYKEDLNKLRGLAPSPDSNKKLIDELKKLRNELCEKYNINAHIEKSRKKEDETEMYYTRA